MPRQSHDSGLLEAALYGYQVQKDRIDGKIHELQAMLKGNATPVPAPKAAKSGGRRQMSATARARIAAAQKKRWAEFHKKRTPQAGA
jgi:hypothetical protein